MLTLAMGILSTVQAARKQVYTLELSDLVSYVLEGCPKCQFLKNKAVAKQPLHLQPCQHPFEHWCFDFVGPSLMTKNGNQYMITALDSRTDQPKLEPKLVLVRAVRIGRESRMARSTTG